MLFHQFRFAVVVLIACVSSSCAVVDPHNIIGRMARPPEAQGPLTFNQRTEVVDLVWETINDRYIDPKFNGFDWVAIKKQYAPRFTDTLSEPQFWELLDIMVGELGDSHARVESPLRVRERESDRWLNYGIGLSRIENQIVVNGVDEKSDAWFAGIRTGMIVDSINGVAVSQLFEQVQARVRKQSTRWRQDQDAVSKLVEATEQSSLQIAVIRGDLSPIAVTLRPRESTGRPRVESRVLPSGFGYIHFSSFQEALRKSVLLAIDEHKERPGVIIDLRGNGGGSNAMARAIVERFMTRDGQPWTEFTRNGVPVKLFGFTVLDRREKFNPAGANAYAKPVVILTNLATASASEAIAGAMRELGNTTIVGRTTCGCLLGFLGPLKLPGGGELIYSEIGFVTAAGRRLEGEGVVPDVLVPLSLAGLRSGRDLTLEAGVRALQEKTQKN